MEEKINDLCEKFEKIQVKHDWYSIPEVGIDTFVPMVKSLYDVLISKKSISKEDPFTKRIFMSFYDQTMSSWEEEHRKIQKERAFTMAMGMFHQKLMGSFDGWVNYGSGHESGCDIGRRDGTCVAEIKNNVNTMNSSSQASVIQKLKKQQEKGKKVYLIIVNGDISRKEKEGIIWISGKDFYSEVSGNPHFMSNLLQTLEKMFSTYKTFKEVKDSLKSS